MVNIPVIDFHAHGGGWRARAFDDDPQRYIEIMDAAGIDKTCIFCIWYGDHKRANDLIKERFLDAYPERFIGVAFITPHHPEEVLVELDRAFDELEYAYLKTYPDYFGRPSDHPAYFPAYEWANDRGIVVMCHGLYPFDPAGTTLMKRYEKLTERFPGIRWVIAHGAQGTSQDHVDVARTFPNVYLETSSSGSPLGGIKYAVDRGLADKILFGTDMPIMDARHQIGKVITLDISENDKRKILGMNAIKLLGLSV